ncbi:hypothetical protein [Williamsia sp. Leaf354]|uniref:hypothetical protein n=1 Tax=Williamsia sp. Leaf354 TaxID=1736349 RepID=UPI0012E38126|nr:hypothetical protein [Williamsia sp. Leaf354]
MNDDGIDLTPETRTSFWNTRASSASEPGSDRFRSMLTNYLAQTGEPPVSEETLRAVEEAMASDTFSRW